jgi:dCTP deaminase
MILTGSEIRMAATDGRIHIDPFDGRSTKDGGRVGPNSYDLTLADKLIEYVPDAPVWRDSPHAEGFELHPLDMKKDNPVRRIEIPVFGFTLMPGKLYLGVTNERFGSKHFVPWIEGRSSSGRLGLGVHVTAGRGDLGYYGRWTLEITVPVPLTVYAGARVAQAVFFVPSGVCDELYEGKYGGADDDGWPQPSRMWRDFLEKQ